MREQSNTDMNPEEMGMGAFSFERDLTNFDRLMEADALMEEERFKEAKEIADEVLETDPNDRDAFFISVQASISEGDYTTAMDLLEERKELYPEDPYLFIQLAEIHLLKFDFLSALKKVEKALELEPDLFDAMILKAQIFDMLDDERFEETIKKARELNEQRTELFLDQYRIDPFFCKTEEDRMISMINDATHLLKSEETKEAKELISDIRDMDTTDIFKNMIDKAELECLMMEGEEEKVGSIVKERLEEDLEDILSLFYSAKLAHSRRDNEKALERVDKVISMAEEENEKSDGLFEYYGFKASVLESMGEGSSKEWYEKARKSEEESLESIKAGFEEAGIPFKIEDDMINIPSPSHERANKDRKNQDKKDERKEKSLDEFV
ncbi:MAG: tetratricopeptide repeat protein [Thermoplasmatota archaeon]